MTVSLKKYLWQFFGIYFLGFVIGLAAIYAVDTLWGMKLQDALIIIALSSSIPYYIGEKFIKNEGRYFTDTEQKAIIKKMSLIALGVSMIPTLIYFGYAILVKLLLTPHDISLLASKKIISTMDTTLLGLNNSYLIAIIIGGALLYYLIIRLSIGSTVKRIGKKYNKK